MKDFKKCLDDFLNNKTYIMSYRFNYDSAREFNNELISYIKDLQKYKSLYQNEKDKNDTLNRIIKEVKKYLEGAYEMATYTNSVCLDEENIEDILDLLKEIK